MKTIETEFYKWLIKEVGTQDADLFTKGSLVREVAIKYAKFYASQSRDTVSDPKEEGKGAEEIPSDEIINKKIFEICTRTRQWDGKSHPVTVPELMNEFVVWFKSQLK